MNNYKAEVYCDGVLQKTQFLGQSRNHWRKKEVLKALFNEIKPLAAKNPQKTYYVEIRPMEKM